jgi:Integrase core domain
MSRKEVPRPGLLELALAGQITNQQGAAGSGLTVRQFQRVKVRYRAEGPHGLLHRRRGQPSSRALASAVRARVAELLQSVYRDVNDCHATEKLREVDGLAVSRASVRRIRRALGLPAKHRRRPRQHRRRRTPAPRMGALVLLDGSQFAWLEVRGPTMTLLGAIDDASGGVVALYFRPTEDLHGYVTLLSQLAARHGLPLALYGDRLNVFVRNDQHWSLEEELQGAQHPTQFGRILQDLGIGYIPAGSPQAKGRIERLWRTLQDRLVVEMRLRGLATLEAANAFLPEFLADYNRRFAHPAADPTPAWRRPPPDLANVLSCRYRRTVARDNTVRLGGRWAQIPPGPRRRSYAGCRVEARECFDGRLLIYGQGGVLLAMQPWAGPEFVLRPRHAPHPDHRQSRGASRSASEEGDRYLPIPRKRASSRPTPSAPRAPRQVRPAPAHPWRQPYNPHLLEAKGLTIYAKPRG